MAGLLMSNSEPSSVTRLKTWLLLNITGAQIWDCVTYRNPCVANDRGKADTFGLLKSASKGIYTEL